MNNTGALRGDGGTVTISSSSFTGNSATGPTSDAGAVSLGGNGSSNDTLTITGSTFANNSAGFDSGALSASGGGGNTDHLTVTNTTIEGNTVNAANGRDGGATLFAATTTLRSDTIDGNSAGGASSFAGGIAAPGTATVANTIIAGNSAHTGANCFSPVTSEGHNIESANTCGFTASGDQVNTDPRLATLADNGGPAATQALKPGSPAIDAGDNSACPSTDERGVARPQGAACDIGAYELAPPSATTGAATAVGPTSAVLNGSAANPDVQGATVYFQYGTTTAYGQTTTAVPLPAQTPSTNANATLVGLAPQTTYHFRIVAVNPDGASLGTDQTFTTAPPPPTLSKLTIKPKRFRAKRGATVSYRDSQPATTTFTVLKPVGGFRVGGRCVAHPGHTKHPKRCTRYVRVGSFKHHDHVGKNKLHFKRRLKPGRYRLQAIARNAAGEKSRPVTIAFRIVL